MKKTLTIAFALLLSIGAYAQEFKAGAAKVDITPRQEQVVNKTDIIRDKIQVKAIYMTDGVTLAVIVSVDFSQVMQRMVSSMPSMNFIGSLKSSLQSILDFEGAGTYA